MLNRGSMMIKTSAIVLKMLETSHRATTFTHEPSVMNGFQILSRGLQAHSMIGIPAI